MNPSFTAAITPPADLSGPAIWFIFRGTRLLVQESGAGADLPRMVDPADLGLAPILTQYLGRCETPQAPFHAFAAAVTDDTAPPEDMAFYGLRQLYGRLPEALFWLAGRAVQIVEWDRTTRFCGHCGVPTALQSHERAKKCPQCGRSLYPRLSPAVIVLVQKRPADGPAQLLLARSLRHPPGMFSVLAGFVEPGETLETAVRREVREEVAIEVKNIRYFGSQPWPFPDSLMVAFVADYAGGEISLEEEEMAAADWFTADNLPQVPPPISIARQLIDWFVAQYGRRGAGGGES